jgi:hypothetical protein
MNNLFLKYSSLLLSESFDDLNKETTKSKQKIKLYGVILTMTMILWFLNGFLITTQILDYPINYAVIVGFISMFIVYTIELTIIRMSKINFISTFIRVIMALIIAFIGSLSIDEIIFKPDIENQLKINSQNEYLNIPSVVHNNTQKNQLNFQLENTNNDISDLRTQMILESKTGYGPKTKLIERQLIDLNQKKTQYQREISTLIHDQNNNLITNTEKTGIIKNIQAFIDFNNNNKIGWFIWAIFFVFFLLLELMCIIYKYSSDTTSFERKKDNIDSFEKIKFKNLQDYTDDRQKIDLNNYYKSLKYV